MFSYSVLLTVFTLYLKLRKNFNCIMVNKTENYSVFMPLPRCLSYFKLLWITPKLPWVTLSYPDRPKAIQRYPELPWIPLSYPELPQTIPSYPMSLPSYPEIPWVTPSHPELPRVTPSYPEPSLSYKKAIVPNQWISDSSSSRF